MKMLNGKSEMRLTGVFEKELVSCILITIDGELERIVDGREFREGVEISWVLYPYYIGGSASGRIIDGRGGF